MAKTGFQSVPEYLGTLPKETQPILEQVRSTLRRALPDADECISYQIPCYKMPGGAVIFFAGWKEHFSLYPATDGVLEKFAKELARYEVSKGTIRFPYSDDVPTRLLERIAKFRARQTALRAKGRPPAKKKAAPKRRPSKSGRSRARASVR